MAEYTGSGLYVTFGGTVLSADFRTMEVEETADLIECSAGADGGKTFIKGYDDGTASIELVDQSGTQSWWSAMKAGNSGTLIWGPEGTASGKNKQTVFAWVKNRNRSMPYNDLVVVNAEFQFSGTITNATW